MLNGTASERLLDSYHAERRPVALANTALSVANWQEAVRVPSALGLDPRAASLLDSAANTGEDMASAVLEKQQRDCHHCAVVLPKQQRDCHHCGLLTRSTPCAASCLLPSLEGMH